MQRVAVIGTGNICPSHLRGLLEFPDRCKVVALVDIYPEKALKMKKEFNLDCDVFDSSEALLNSQVEIDLVHICTPPFTHAPLAIQFMDAGKNVVVEKPIAPSLKECDAMLEAESRNGVVMACIAQNRFRDSIYKLKTMVDMGELGKICCTHVNSLWWRGHSYYDLWWRGLWEKEGGGPTLNHAVHHIDMINWIYGEMPTEVMAMLTNVMHDNAEVEDLSMAILRYNNGSLAQVTSSVIHHGEEQGIILQCENGKISAPWDVKVATEYPNGFPQENTEAIHKINRLYDAIESLTYEGHTGEIDNILTALEQGKKPLITGKDGRNTVELITGIYKSGCTKKMVTLPIDEKDEFYNFDGLIKNAIYFHEKGESVNNLPDFEITVGNYDEKN